MAPPRVLRQAASVAIGLALVGAMHAAGAAQACAPADAGCAIFTGERALTAHLRDDDRSLPPATSRCANCHTGTPSAASFAPLLTPDYLLTPTKRRGGPASSYDEKNFCQVLRNGVDPAGVLVRKAMPRYEISDNECTTVWRYLTKR